MSLDSHGAGEVKLLHRQEKESNPFPFLSFLPSEKGSMTCRSDDPDDPTV